MANNGNNGEEYTLAECDTLIKKGNKEKDKANYVKALEYYTVAREMALSKNWDRQLFNSLFCTGFSYYSMFDYGEALHFFLDAYNIAVKNKWHEQELECLNNIANIYARQKMYEKAIEYYTKAYKGAKDKNIESHIWLPQMNLGYIYNRMNKPEKARPYLLESTKHLEGHFLASSKVLLIENDLLLGDVVKARKGAWDLYNNEPNAAEMGLDIFLWTIISKSYLKENNYSQAIVFAKRALNRNPDLEFKKNVFVLLSDIYEKSGSYKDALRFKDSILVTEHELTERNNGRVFENNRVKFEIQDYKNQIYVKEQKLASERRVFYAIIVIICATVIIIVLIFRQKKMIAECSRNIIELHLEKEKNYNLKLERKVTKALLEQERLNEEIENKNKKLSSRALYLSDRNEIIEEIVAYLSKKPKLAKDQTLVNHVNSLKAYLRTDNEWDNFIKHFEEVNQGFMSRLKELHQDLSVNDIRFIAYIYMGLSVKEIATVLNITLAASKKRKERLSAKMNISKEVDLYSYISSI
ncbi:Tetratricopeptide TPR_2 repeat protein [Flavobacterium beibuense]|uniref:Tetratricopeptide TPR_2 repeat protein n=2 Tax=Flavobacterium beibuense TaxID=657326 RepID=A0A444W3Y1_9FLAO|nr:Tetratricopeptide TPR_2 repeat protein [Flavobacterium beibuense]